VRSAESASSPAPPELNGAAPVASRSDDNALQAGFRHVLVCLDRSEAAEAALPLATHLALTDGARLTLLHVLETPADVAAVRTTDPLEWEVARQEATAYLEHAAEQARARDVVTEAVVAEGVAAQQVAALAEEFGADLIVLSTYGEGGGGLWDLGGTARKILALARGTILIVPPPVAALPAHVPLRRILVPLDGSLRGESVLPTALRLARANGAEVVVAHVVADPIRSEILADDEDLELAHRLADRGALRAEHYLNRVRAQLTAGAVRARAALCRCNDHREGLVGLAAAEGASLVVVSAHGSVCNARRRFGTVTSYLIARCAAPVLVIQDLPVMATQPASAPAGRLPQKSVNAVGRRN
jgi:nucleotide-binding universal stress UspA family protein